MDVRCDRCETEYELDDSIVTEGGASVQCTTCGHTFVLRRTPSGRLATTGGATRGAGNEPFEAGAPEVPEWTLSTDDGKVHRFRDLNILQRWIVERKVGRTERIARAGGPWLSLSDLVELTPFFNIVDEADRARALAAATQNTPTRPVPVTPATPGRALGSFAGEGLPAPIQNAVELARPISQDGPTVPNRRLPGFEPPASPARPPIPLPGVRGSAPARDLGATVVGGISEAPRPRVPGSGIQAVAGRDTENKQQDKQQENKVEAKRLDNQRDKPPASTADNEIGPREGIRPPGVRAELLKGPSVTAEAHPLESELSESRRGGKGALVGVIVLVIAASGGYWWWLNRQKEARRADSSTNALVDGAVPGARGPSNSGTAPLIAPTRSDRAVSPADQNAADGAAGRQGEPLAAAPTAAPAGGNSVRPRTAASARAASSSVTGGGGRLRSTEASRSGGAHASGDSAGYDRLIAEADRLLEQGRSARAEKLYAQALSIRPDGVGALTGIAYVLLDRQRHFKAIETFRKALAIQPSFGPALFGIAESYRARGDSAQALGAYRKYLAISPSGTDAPAARRQIKELESASPSGAEGAAPKSTGDVPAEDP